MDKLKKAFTLPEILIATIIGSVFFAGVTKFSTMVMQSFNTEQSLLLLSIDIRNFSLKFAQDARNSTSFELYKEFVSGPTKANTPDYGNCITFRYNYDSSTTASTNTSYKCVVYYASSTSTSSLYTDKFTNFPLYRNEYNISCSNGESPSAKESLIIGTSTSPTLTQVLCPNINRNNLTDGSDSRLFWSLGAPAAIFYRTLNGFIFVNTQFMRTSIGMNKKAPLSNKLTCQLVLKP